MKAPEQFVKSVSDARVTLDVVRLSLLLTLKIVLVFYWWLWTSKFPLGQKFLSNNFILSSLVNWLWSYGVIKKTIKNFLKVDPSRLQNDVIKSSYNLSIIIIFFRKYYYYYHYYYYYYYWFYFAKSTYLKNKLTKISMI